MIILDLPTVAECQTALTRMDLNKLDVDEIIKGLRDIEKTMDGVVASHVAAQKDEAWEDARAMRIVLMVMVCKTVDACRRVGVNTKDDLNRP